MVEEAGHLEDWIRWLLRGMMSETDDLSNDDSLISNFSIGLEMEERKISNEAMNKLAAAVDMNTKVVE